MTPKHISDFTLNSSSHISIVPLGLLFPVKNPKSTSSAAAPPMSIRMDPSPNPSLFSTTTKQVLARPCWTGGEWLLQGYERRLCLHRNKPTSPKDRLGILIKEHVRRTRDIRGVVLGGSCANPNSTASGWGRRWRWPWAKQGPPACFGVPAGQSAKPGRLQKVRQK